MTPARGEEREKKTPEGARGEGREAACLLPTHWARTNIARLATEEGSAGDLRDGSEGRDGGGEIWGA